MIFGPRKDLPQKPDVLLKIEDEAGTPSGGLSSRVIMVDDDQGTSTFASDVTSCEVAAQIIASMRGNDDTEGVRSELGCGAAKECVVKNIDIFQIADNA